ncbi:MAG: hypothetical protein P1V97_06425, partial [Planctomycetota bacterium]|nr:hypothetical protein [Planctomycetota bacterium]
MAKEALNKIKYRQFASKCRGARITKVTVTREDRKTQVLFRFNARAAKGGKRFNGEWVVEKKERPADEIETLEKAFLEILRKDFMISKGTGFGSSDAEKSEESSSEQPEAAAAE